MPHVGLSGGAGACFVLVRGTGQDPRVEYKVRTEQALLSV